MLASLHLSVQIQNSIVIIGNFLRKKNVISKMEM